jgi:sodium-independent sulfate anion transporter 11
MSSVNNVDVTSVQNLIDVRNQLDRYATPNIVAWHFAAINNRWSKRALAAAGFGYPPNQGVQPEGVGARPWKSIFSVAEIGGSDSAAHAAELEQLKRTATADVELAKESNVEVNRSGSAAGRLAAVHGVNLPLFHVDLVSAVQAALVQDEGKIVPL